MAAWRPHGRARVDPDSPRAWGTCSRCGFNYNLRDFAWQHQFSGRSLINLNLLVCPSCLDTPAPFLRVPVLPPDPPGIMNARPEPYDIDETDYRVTTAAEIRETEDLVNLRITEENTPTSTWTPPQPPSNPIPSNAYLNSDGTTFFNSDGSYLIA